jgi:hypothetical protein
MDAGKNAGARPCAMTGACDPEKPAPDLIRGGNRLSEKIMLAKKLERQSIQSEAIALWPSQ